MPTYTLNSVDDERLAIFRALPKSQLAKQGGFFITEGDLVTERLFASRFEPVSVMVEPRYVEKYELLTQGALPIYVVSEELMRETVGFPFHRGVMGCGLRTTLPRCEFVVPPQPQNCLLAVLPETQDPTNLGVMLRTCAALGVDAALLGSACADVFSRRVIRVSTGSALQIPLARLDPREDFSRLQNELHVELCATVVHRPAVSLTDFVPPQRAGIVIGSEGHGLAEEWIQLCQHQVTIPMDARVDSLNANIATGILLYEFAKSRSHRAKQ
jgi:tRNA G18 (ribose-2'-O)-methylase SpoU